MAERVEPGTTLDGRYRVHGRLGEGGMAEVWRADDQQLGRPVALKLLSRRFAGDREFVERFRREASAAAGLQHPNIVGVYDRGEADGTPYIAMEFVDGRTLKQLVQDDGPLEPDRAIDLVEQVLRAASFAHRRGIIHRDLKPQNVIVDAEDRAKVTDFGIARAGSASQMTQTGSVMGTAQYLSPEQAQGRPVSPASDLYAVGIILYELLTGRVPFDGDSAVAVAVQQVNEAPVPPSRLRAGISPALEQVVLRALEKEPGRRYASAEEMMAALEGARGVDRTQATRALPATGLVAAVPGPPRVLAPRTGAYDVVPEVVALEEPPSRRGWWIAGILALLAAVALLVVLLTRGGTEQVRVPGVVGRTAATAQARLEQRGLVSEVRERASASKPRGQVYRTSPRAGTKVDKNSTVVLFVSAGPAQMAVPDVAGQTAAAATAALQQQGFTVSSRTAASGDVAKGQVIRTEPAAGQRRAKGSEVRLVVSSGPQAVSIPDVTGRDQADARSALADAGFDSRVVEEASASQDPGTVLRQNPAGGQSRPKGTRVTLTVARAPTTVEVPDVTGQSQDDASQALTDANFKVEVVQRATGDQAEDGQVLEQSPAAGQARRGATVKLTVGAYDAAQDPTATPATPSDGTGGVVGGG